MRGSTRKRGTTWTALWDAYDPTTGSRRQRSKGGFRTQKEAQTHLATVITATAAGEYVEPSKQLLGRFLQDEWLPAIRSTVRPLTCTGRSAKCRCGARPPAA
ncbi:MAG: Arm DNA-binding domain-containing protein [Solirubrobacteraceae bacterium]